ncbi:hypothetical protein ERO13_A02G142702v2 [Gossypium hirsutum]|uniref:Uncharacterized protein n=2 Tax=Gossypium TaxID=3633 RepID=A0A5D2RLA4_GOSTO|nr:hypothetical protein ERO13_A02G142702v2 [Gossypium hirsutum]TYH28794.1 hypothetical protein ES288_A02G172100v1 [Gossypium darwinii]TYI40600.1 hypothetical protein ES332_A02G174200v1 [Gossypium tomentosum]
MTIVSRIRELIDCMFCYRRSVLSEAILFFFHICAKGEGEELGGKGKGKA